MEATRARNHGDLEVGYADVLQPHIPKAPAQHAAPPQWLQTWEDKRPGLLMDMFSEALGVFIYCFFGAGATAAFFITSVAKMTGFGSLLVIALSYAIGVVIAITVCGPASGGHLSPCFTIAFWLLRGFPGKKVPFYIVAQIFGAFVGLITQLDLISVEFEALGLNSFTPQGPAGVLALFTTPGQDLKYVFLGEFMCNVLLSICVFSVLDPSNVFISFSSAPFVIALAYLAIIVSYAPNTIALNTARDVGGRLACAAVYGRKCWAGNYAALSSLTNILATMVGAMIQITLMSHTGRPIVNNLPDADGPSLRAISRGDASMRVISKETSSNEKRA